MATYQKQIGSAGELFVARYLETQGFSISFLNFSFRGGELDIVAEKPGLRIFVEVKTRRNPLFSISELVNFSKQAKIIRTAHHFNRQFGYGNDLIHRFDVACVTATHRGFELDYIENAFTQPEGSS